MLRNAKRKQLVTNTDTTWNFCSKYLHNMGVKRSRKPQVLEWHFGSFQLELDQISQLHNYLMELEPIKLLHKK